METQKITVTITNDEDNMLTIGVEFDPTIAAQSSANFESMNEVEQLLQKYAEHIAGAAIAVFKT